VTFKGTIPSSGYSNQYTDFLRDKFYEKDPNYGTPGTYIASDPWDDGFFTEWTWQP
jgi:hypothetical protein